MKTLLLIDANSLIHRAYHALPKTFTAPDGTPTNALYGLSRILLKILKEERPDYIAACFDRPEPTFRKEEFKDYKAHRPPTPDDLVTQIIASHELFGAFHISVFEALGFEADDLIATLTEKFSGEEDVRIVILTGDLDTLQLVRGDRIVVRTPKKGIRETISYDEDAVRARYDLAPQQLVDYKAFVGDPSDNIKGIPGVGPKTATELIHEFGTVENTLEGIDDTHRLARKLLPHREEVLQAKRLVTLRKDAPLRGDALSALATEASPDSLTAYFSQMGFSSLVKNTEEKTQGNMFR